MAQVAIEELLRQCNSVYKLVLLAAKRAKEVSEGSPALIDTPHRKVTSVALEEILQGRVLYKADAEEKRAVKSRRAAKKDDKKKRG